MIPGAGADMLVSASVCVDRGDCQVYPECGDGLLDESMTLHSGGADDVITIVAGTSTFNSIPVS